MPVGEIYNSTLYDDPNLQLYCRMESDGTDESSNGYTMAPGTSPAFSPFKFGNGGDFESSSSQFLTNAAANCSVTGSQSWGCWVNFESISAGVHRLMGRMNAGAAFNSVNIMLEVGVWSFLVEGLTTNTKVQAGSPSTATDYSVIGVYDSSATKLKIFIDGSKTEVTASGSATTAGTENTSLGRAGNYAADYLDGLGDEFFMFDRALTDTEASDIANENLTSRFPPEEASNVIFI